MSEVAIGADPDLTGPTLGRTMAALGVNHVRFQQLQTQKQMKQEKQHQSQQFTRRYKSTSTKTAR